ncbi:MAG: alpha-D-ribose 1-methylphosphonate 5-triphosphate diphosphatase [gamma proteobacterium symbiont of Ctena orbiculata]|uniref:Alpha-D-ribose 1-methylphosphonate 5-triphosphate diphosphatase n=1 Tax=Candidatus Thiodiazotropha taylori TaxID=2792791 RepID=A0A944MDC2_9GAMM|nr:alpha-D-ribose 1-methylphosphonate 5-triphosphate diphosphatase [Candidatus Thiodiazotropha taylori]PUB81137.1 MAG: alpha-D-ribose 1-methylphosphonate 5-triphosphate diphosphatase [gamma proteobacterium symbiont of Ctena orbiculata]MBT2990579.1 alpha-D-ribose 1-methylphosphonate 5-triphosphate diphosphatase [Candidatus Thiodiazotropha taylori]MBT2998126.1 alpha-D-ribose 1-methylphosphonate 5-triphosphate diphosphatase [Candidatus Thiodiazotropha taylori]MBT3002425.1 alpha-D-ribose 1-methylph
MKTCLTHARVVLFDEIAYDASVLIEDGVITAIDPLSSAGSEVIDLQGKWLLPGMVDLHCDALEKEVEPRPNVHFPLTFACAQADKRNAAAGITTVYHALSFAHDELGVRNSHFAAEIARAVHDWHPHGLVDNRVHCRYEITDETGLPILKELLAEQSMHLISMMDHTPGQGQFKDMAAYRDYLTRTYKKTADEVEVIVERKIEAASGAYARMYELALAAHAAGISVASHDDDSAERITTMSGIGADISEFPICLEAARAAKAAGMSTIVGAPNIIRGKSQSGSMRAVDAIHEGVADCLCADYAPATLIMAIMALPGQTDLDLPSAVRLVTANPAKAAKLEDRGVIEAGKRADLIAVGEPGGLPQVTDAWVHGKPAYRARYDHG